LCAETKYSKSIIDGIKATKGKKGERKIYWKILVYMQSQYSAFIENADSNNANIFIRTLQEYFNARCSFVFLRSRSSFRSDALYALHAFIIYTDLRTQ
jgi:hypothetical protein